ncbi:hypothetical protein PGB34_03850 [Xenophilus arseniciresistens]|uniref:Uncharacterized protein n=1 Tax=Xenophilus arseniciresistens TaxID=1283306 RepID=A0AAE3N5Y9_9BURK|nr:hypothetical protein [Xenophilus arseniciresistens]MDA7415488.1 hypothetical protein [Xenophilus arseniciresistens]
MKLSSFGLSAVAAYTVIVVVGRILYPFGDEPDFSARAPYLIFSEKSWIDPYYWLQSMLDGINLSSNCSIQGGAFSFWSDIEFLTCSEPLPQVLRRIILTLFVSIPLIIAICFHRKQKIRPAPAHPAIVLGGSILLPGMTYYLGVLSYEQWTLVLSLLLVLVSRSYLIMGLIAVAVCAIDFGNGIVVLSYVLLTPIYRYFLRKKSLKFTVIVAVLQICVAGILGLAFLSAAGSLSALENKASAIEESLAGSDLVGKYPLILRPAITFMTAIFMTPAFVKIIPLYIVFGFAIFFGIIRLREYLNSLRMEEKKNSYELNEVNIILTDAIVALTTICSIVFILPTYSNAKYYIFLAPILLRPAFLVYAKTSIFFFMLMSQVVVFFFLMAFRLN